MDRIWFIEWFDTHHRLERGGPGACHGIDRNEINFRSRTHTGVATLEHSDSGAS